MNKIRIFIIEDDFIQFNKLEMLLEGMGYELAGHADHGDEALNLIAATNPDLLLVDIEIKGNKTGIEVVERQNQRDPIPVIFTTSFKDKETIDKAKQTEPYAYLIKPFEKETLQAAIELALFRFRKSPDILRQNLENSGWDEDQLVKGSFFLKSSGMLTKVMLADIRYVEVKDKNCLVGVENEVLTMRIPLHKMEEKLPFKTFIRVHRSFIINSQHIDQVDITNHQVIMGDYRIPVGRAYRESLLNNLDMIS